MIRLLHRLIGYDDGHVIILYKKQAKRKRVRRTQPIFFLLATIQCYNATMLQCYTATMLQSVHEKSLRQSATNYWLLCFVLCRVVAKREVTRKQG